jgi:hypothetical protein
MHQSKLIELMGLFDKKELRGFEKFLHSPYFNQRDDVIRLFLYISEHLSDPTLLAKPDAFAHVFPQEGYSEKKIRYTMSFLYKLALSFLSIHELESNPFQKQALINKAIRRKNSERIFTHEINITKKMLEESKLRNIEYHYFNYLLTEEETYFPIGQSREPAVGFQKLSNELNLYYIATSLKQSCFAVSINTFSKMGFDQGLIQQVLEHVESNDFSDTPAVSVYFLAYKALSSTNSFSYFKMLREEIGKHGSAFPPSELKDIYILAINFCIRRINAGDEPFKREAFELYRDGLKQNIFIENKRISRFTYKNIVAAGLGLNEYEWVKKFIDEHQIFLEKKYRNSTYNFNLSLYYFKKEEYGKAMELLQQVGTDDVLNNLNARRMLLRIYYDLDEMDALESLLSSFQTYIYRKKDLGYHRDLYLNLIRFTRRLLQLDFRDKEKTALLQNDIEKSERVAEKTWLLEKLGNSKK